MTAIKHEHKSRGHRWRVQSGPRGIFDEIVVVVGKDTAPGQAASGLIIHAEMTDNRSCFVDVAGICLWVHVGRDGIARIVNAEDRRESWDEDDVRQPPRAAGVRWGATEARGTQEGAVMTAPTDEELVEGVRGVPVSWAVENWSARKTT